jgi:hypothetical protein
MILKKAFNIRPPRNKPPNFCQRISFVAPVPDSVLFCGTWRIIVSL